MRTLLAVLAVCLSVAGCGGTSGSDAGVVTTAKGAVLVSISVAAASPAIPKAFSEQFAATGTYSDGTSADITSSVAWSSGDTTVATVNAAGLVSGIIAGTSPIRATLSAISGSTTVVITAATLSSIAITPGNLTLPNGLTQQLTATGNYSDGTSLNITSSVTWSSDNAAMAIVDASGVARAVATGTVHIAATFDSISGGTVLTATSATLESLAITPTNPSIPSGLTQKLAAIGRYSDGSSHDITSSVIWSSSSGLVAPVDATGLARGLAAGTSAISATSGAVSAGDTLTVTSATISSITIGPANPSVIQGLTQQLTATATYSDGTSFDFTSVVTWSSSATAVATVTAAGTSSAVSVGSATITATFGGISSIATLNVSSATLTSIALMPAAPSVAKGLSQQMTALGTFSNGTSSDITSSVTWSSSNGLVATVDAAGLAHGVSVGTSTIGAASGTVSANTTLTVIAASLSAITIAPASPSIYRPLTQQFTAIGTYSDGTQLDITSSASWSSSATNVATVSAVGLATPNGEGTSTISATLGAISANTALTVTAPPLVTTQVVFTLPTNASTSQSIAVSVDTASGTQEVRQVREIIPTSSVCTAANICTITFGAPVGSDTFTFTAYDQANTGSGAYSGNILAESVLTYTVSAGGPNQINAQMWGIPVSIEITPTSTSYYLIGSVAAGFGLYGTAAQSVNIVGYDADHNVITGPGTPPFIVSAPSSVVVTQPTSSSPSVYGLQAVAFNVSGTLTVAVPPISLSAPPPPTETVTVVTHHRAVYVADQAAGTVDTYYDGQIQPASMIISSEVDGLAVNTNGSIIVPLSTNEVDVYALGRTAVPTYSITLGINSPAGACTDHEENIYVVNGNGVAMYVDGQPSMSTDYILDENLPIACAIDPDDSLWVINSGDSTIVHYPHSSTTPDQYWTLAGGTGESPQGLAIDRSGNLYVSSLDASNVSRARFYPKGSQSPSFALITQQGAQIAGSLAVDASGALWVGNFGGPLVYYPAPVTSNSVPINPGYAYLAGSQIVGIAVTP